MEPILGFIFGVIVCYLAMTGLGKLQAGRKVLAGPPKPSPEEQKKKAEKDKAEKAKARRMQSDGFIYLLVCTLLIGFIIFVFMNSIIR